MAGSWCLTVAASEAPLSVAAVRSWPCAAAMAVKPLIAT